MSERGLELALEKMRAAGLPEPACTSFAGAWRQAAGDAAGLMPEADLEPAEGIPALADVTGEAADPALLDKLCVMKLNGGLGTGMGLEKAKSLIAVKDGLTFLDFIARQILRLRASHGRQGPRFLLMDSFSTSADTLAFLARYPELLPDDGQIDFLQGKVPKLRADTLEPVDWPSDRSLEWCPPGHGDLYPSMAAGGWFDRLADEGVEYLFVSNSDNLGATVDLPLLGYFARSGLAFLMEVAARTPSDRKGGHLARRRSDGRFVLREVAQCPGGDMDAFQDISLHRCFNTNNLWLRLSDLRAAIDTHGGSLPLPLIRNVKTVDPRDPSSPEVLQLEGAMGAAIECFADAGAVLVPRTRFAPVKTTGDLLALRSDAFRVTADMTLELVPERVGIPPEIELDAKHYKTLAGLENAFGGGAPSLRRCERIEVHGPWAFGADVDCRGRVVFRNDTGDVARAEAGVYADMTVVP